MAGPTIKYAPREENGVYGASRIGVFKRDATLVEKGYTLYELTDHLGNVRAVIRKTPAGLLSLTNKADYYPFGSILPNRQITDGNYRYAFQGQEKDGETGMEAFELRLWDGRLGRWLSVDPMGQYASPYLGMGNNPISRIDPDGGSDYPERDGYSCGETMTDADGTWMWDSDTKMWMGQTSGSGDWHQEVNATNIQQAEIRPYVSNIFDKTQSFLSYDRAETPTDYVISFLGKKIYNIADSAHIWGTGYISKSSDARHLDGSSASGSERIDGGLTTLYTFLPTPIKGRFATIEANKPFMKPFNASSFSQFFKGNLSRLNAQARGFLIKTINSRLIKKFTSRGGIIKLNKKVSKKLSETPEEDEE